MSQDSLAYFNGEWIPLNECGLSMEDRGFTLGDAVFEVERTFNHKIFDLDGHLDRLYRSLKFVRIDPGLTKDEMRNISEEAVKRVEHLGTKEGDFHVRQVVTRGPSGGSPTVFVSASPAGFNRYAPLYTQGCHVVFARTRSYHPDSLDPKVKHQSRMNFVLASLEAADIDPDAFPVMLDLNGNVTEGTGFNFWIVTDGVLKTAGERSILQGVSRKAIIEIARELNIPVSFEDYQLYDAYNADEAFISGTTPCVLPASKLDNRPIGNGIYPGPISKLLLEAWSKKVGVDIMGQARKLSGIDP